jgi:hypothetical protein
MLFFIGLPLLDELRIVRIGIFNRLITRRFPASGFGADVGSITSDVEVLWAAALAQAREVAVGDAVGRMAFDDDLNFWAVDVHAGHRKPCV